MERLTTEQFRRNSRRAESTGAAGGFTDFLGERFYRIADSNAMSPFFMTIVSSSDVWNYIWSNGGLTAGRINANHAIFPYYTADKVSDARTTTGPLSIVKVATGGDHLLWEPFSDSQRGMWKIRRNLYKNKSGSKLYFEEINEELDLTFQYGWTSSERFGLVRHVRILNTGTASRNIAVLDGARNILPACVTSAFQNDNSVLLDAYKRTDLADSGIAVFSVTSIVTDKAEPSEGLFANVSWFSATGKGMSLHLKESTPEAFRMDDLLPEEPVVKGERGAFYLHRDFVLAGKGAESWYQVFDTSLDSPAIVDLGKAIADRRAAEAALEADIESGKAKLEELIARADGFETSADETTAAHHEANVLFNIMRGGIFAEGYTIDCGDFLAAAKARNRKLAGRLEGLIPAGEKIAWQELRAVIEKSGDPQALRLFQEYLPLTFSRRHGDPSRPWNWFSIEIRENDGKPRLNYQGNWRDIFQNWEALALSYPDYLESMVAKFLNACTADGFNPYRVSRDGIDWEVQEPDNPWSNIGYWGDHQIIYLAKLLEWESRFDRDRLLSGLNAPRYSTANVPYRLKSHAEILRDPRASIRFDGALHHEIEKAIPEIGTDARLVRTADGEVVLVSMTEKFLTLILAKLSSLFPGGGIWLNTQRPEWNDANNALAGYGLSVVTLCYLRRFLAFLEETYRAAEEAAFAVSAHTARFVRSLSSLYESQDSESLATPLGRRAFVDAAGTLFEAAREAAYRQEGGKTEDLAREELLASLRVFRGAVEGSIRSNRRGDGLYHAYNTMSLDRDGGIQIHELYEMLEGQVAVLSSLMLEEGEVLELCRALRASRLFREDQHSYILYPNRELPAFMEKNAVRGEALRAVPLLARMLERGDRSLVSMDSDGTGHFNPAFRNKRDIGSTLERLSKELAYDSGLLAEGAPAIYALYEDCFHHQSFTGRSGTFYAYEGLGSIYWHMVSKLLLAVQENIALSKDDGIRRELAGFYQDVRSGLGFNKSPASYGAFPVDPYSHTPSGAGAKQPGMTGQVKEEILTRWREHGLSVENGVVTITPTLLAASEFSCDGELGFSWCGVPFIYRRAPGVPFDAKVKKIRLTIGEAGKTATRERAGNALTQEESRELFGRTGRISKIEVFM